MASNVNLTYLYFDVRDYSNASILSSYTLDITPLSFIPDFTSSSLLSGSNKISNKKIKWDFGDGTQSTTLTGYHTYKWPGKYKVTLTVYDSNGFAYDSSYQPIINVYDFIHEQILFRDFGKFIYDVPASRIIDPLIIDRYSSWQSYNALSASGGYTIGLYASGAAGDFQDSVNFENDKWSHLRSLSRFYIKKRIGVTEQYVLVDKLSTTNTEFYAGIINNTIQLVPKGTAGSEFVGTTGSGTFYYVDDRVKNFTSREPPILIFCTLDNAKYKDEFSQRTNIFNYIDYPPYGFQNIAPAVQPIIKVRHNPAQNISITTTGIDGEGTLSSSLFNIPEISWQKTQIPFVARLKDEAYFTTKTYPPLSSSTTDSALNTLTSYNMEFGLVYTNNTGTFPYTAAAFYEDFTADAPQSLGAFYKGYFVPLESTMNVKLTAQMTLIDPVNFPKDSLVGWIAQPQYSYLTRFFKQSLYNSCLGTVTVDISALQSFFKSDPNRNVYAIAVAPSGAGFGNDYKAWVSDATNDTLIKLDVYGNILSTFYLSAFPVLSGNEIQYRNLLSPVLSSAAPSSIVLDGNSDLWITLFDSISALKLDGEGGYTKAVAEPNLTNFVYYLSSDYNIGALSGYTGENTILPSCIDTDLNNNIWISYTHPISNFLVKYSPVGTLIMVIPFPFLISPAEIVVDRNRNVWVTAINLNTSGFTLSSCNDYVYKFDENGNLYSGFPLSGFKRVGNITIDGAQNAYVAQDREIITRIDGLSASQTNFTVGSGLNQTSYINSFGGLTCDTSNYIWTINNFDQKMYFLDTQMPPPTAASYIDGVNLQFAPELSAYPLSTFQERSFLAYGDWIGFRWINKYMVPFTVTRTVTGESNYFNIYPYLGEYNITKVNEDFDAREYYNSLRYQDVLQEKNIFFNNFLGTIVGGNTAKPYELGKTIYEKIANFVSNKSDPDKANLDSLLSMCKELSIQFELYNYPFPPQLRRLVDLLSIKHKLLWGERNKYNLDFNKRGTVANSNYGRNKGAELSTETSLISSGVPIVSYETFSEQYRVVNFAAISGYAIGQTFPLSTYTYDWGWGLVAPKSLTGADIKNYYKFYEFNGAYENSFYDNIINWTDPLNTLDPYVSSFNSWQNDNGIMQNLISYELSKGLRLFLSANDIVYNSVSSSSNFF
jgi:hypothetical protein